MTKNKNYFSVQSMSGLETETALKQIKKHLHQKGIKDEEIKDFVELITNIVSSIYQGKDDWKQEYNVKDDPCNTSEIPASQRYGENKECEDTEEFHELDNDVKNVDYYIAHYDMDSIIRLVRHMENALMERGITMFFARNYANVSSACDKMENELLKHEQEV